MRFMRRTGGISTVKTTLLQCLVPESPSKFSVTNQKTKIFVKTLQTLAQDRRRSLSLRHGRLTINKEMTRSQIEYDHPYQKYINVRQKYL